MARTQTRGDQATTPDTDTEQGQLDQATAEANASDAAQESPNPDGAPDVPTPSFDEAFIAEAYTLSPELAKETAPKRERNPRQQALDNKVESAHAHWVSVGRPSVWGKIVESG